MSAVEPLRLPDLDAGADTSRNTVLRLVDALGPISPELALVDPVLAARARALLAVPGEGESPRHPRLELRVVPQQVELPAARAALEPAAVRWASTRTALGVATAGILLLLLSTVGVGAWIVGFGSPDTTAAPSTEEAPVLFTAPPTDPSLAPDAIAVLESDVRREPRSARAREALGTAYLRLGRWTDAEAQLRPFVELAPKDRFAHFALGRALEEQGRHSEAQAHFAQAEKLPGGGP